MPASEPNPPLTARGLSAAHAHDRQLKDLSELVGLLCESPAATIHLLDENRQLCTASTNQATAGIPSDACFCSQFPPQLGVCVVADLREDPRFRDHVLVTREPYLRFYAGVPLLSVDAEKTGSLCIRDIMPRRLNSLQQRALETLARQIEALIESQRQLAALESAIRLKEVDLRDLAASDARFRAFLNASPVSVFIKDDEGRMVYCNKALADRFGATPEDWIGKTDFETWPREIAEAFRQGDLRALEANCEIHFEDRTLGPGGHPVIWDVHKYPFVDADRRRSVACMALDVTRTWEAQQEVQRIQQELRVANERLLSLSLTDPLTGLMNRRALEDCLDNECARSIRSGSPLSLFMLDIDDFKGFNDSFGHQSGDEVLRQIAILMRQWTRRGDLVARYGGEEFLVILPDTGADPALRIAERLREAVAAATWTHRPITVSIGVATSVEPMPSIASFIHKADEALYAAKHNGKNQVCQARSDPAQVLE